MLDTEGYMVLTAQNFKQAENHLKDTEVHLRKLLASLENSRESVRRASQGYSARYRNGMTSVAVTTVKEPAPAVL